MSDLTTRPEPVAAGTAGSLLSRRRFLTGIGAAAAVGVGGVPVLIGSMTPLHTDGFAEPSEFAVADIPAELLALFLEAGQRHGFGWHILAAVGWRESGGWSPDVIACQRHSRAGARGLMQFMPATAHSMGIDPCDPPQAIDAAAGYLAGHLARFGSHELALAAYNAGAAAVVRHGGIPPYAETQAYVPAVLERARLYADAYDTMLAAEHIGGDPDTLITLADQGRVRLTARQIADLSHPAMDGRVIAVMETLADRWSYAVSVIKTGHSRCVGGEDRTGCRESNHWHYRAVDIYQFNGEPVSPISGTARRVVEFLAGLPGQLQPSEVGSPFPVASPGHFSDRAHHRHVHIGYRAVTP